MHSSRMRTFRSSSRLCRGGGRADTPPGAATPPGADTPPVDRHTPVKKITFPTSLRTVISDSSILVDAPSYGVFTVDETES